MNYNDKFTGDCKGNYKGNFYSEEDNCTYEYNLKFVQKKIENEDTNDEDPKIPDKVTYVLTSAGIRAIVLVVFTIAFGQLQDSILGYSILEINNLAGSIVMVASIMVNVLSLDRVRNYLRKKLYGSMGKETLINCLGILVFGISIIIAAIFYYFNISLIFSNFISLFFILIALNKLF